MRFGVIHVFVWVMRRLGLFDMITEYPYMVTYRLKATGRKYHYKKVDATHQAEAMRIFEASMPSATVVSAHALPQNFK